nr:hypothetical protein [Tanacetum cinerariifolium]
KEWEKAGKKKDAKPDADAATDMDEEEKMLSKIPFKCIICKEDYKNPVVTKCGHYFCEKCAMTRYMKDKKKQCANCGADTQGSFGHSSLDPKLTKLHGLQLTDRLSWPWPIY